jgi:hypothetical protein
MGRGRGKDRLERDPRELGIRFTSTTIRLLFMLSECAVMVVMPILEGLFVEDGLLDSGMRSP